MRRLAQFLAAPLLVVAALAAGCGATSSSRSASGVVSTLTATPRAAPPPTLSAAAVPYLASTRRSLSVAGLAREAQAPQLAARLGRWGFVAGAERYFQGESRRLQVVDSRTLRFRRAVGAAAYVVFMQKHLSAILGSYPKVQPLAADARRGVLVVGQECQCHLANPSLLAIVARGGTVSWLEINGPGATRRRLATLLARAP